MVRLQDRIDELAKALRVMEEERDEQIRAATAQREENIKLGGRAELLEEEVQRLERLLEEGTWLQ
jgi:hypothetical protein